MKQLYGLKIIAFIFAILSSSAIIAQAGVEMIIAYSNVEFFPYEMGNGNEISKPPGIALELIHRAAKETGIETRFVRYPNKRVLYELESGRVDGACSFSYKEYRMMNGQYPMKDGNLDRERRITNVSYFLYKRSGSPLNWDGSNFKNLGVRPIGANDGYSIVDDLRRQGIKVDEARTTEQNLMKLRKDRISGYAAQDITTDHHAKSGKYGDIVKIPIPLATKDYYLMISHQFMKRHADEAEALWTKIGELRDSVTRELAPKYRRIIE